MIGTLCTSKCTYQSAYNQQIYHLFSGRCYLFSGLSLVLGFAEVELEFVELDGV